MYENKKKKKRNMKRVGRKESKQANESRRRRRGRIRWMEAGEKSFYFWLDIFPPKLIKVGLV